MTLRLFAALEPPAPLRRQIGLLVDELRSLGGAAAARVRWTAPEALHLTLHFLGDVPEERRGDVERAVAEAAAGGRPLSLAIRGAGAFPSARRARALWAGVAGETGSLAALAADLGARLAPLGFPAGERPFSPHLTLGRCRDGAAGLGGALAALRDREVGPWRVGELVLFRSRLSPAGARYEAVARVELGG